MLGGSHQRIFVAVAPVDMRKSFHGLSGLVRGAFDDAPRSGSYFVFFNKKGTQVKILYYDGSDFAIWMKVLDKGTFTRPRGATEKVEFTVETLSSMISGLAEPELKVAA